MPDPMYVARARAEKVSGAHRRLTLATGESFESFLVLLEELTRPAAPSPR